MKEFDKALLESGNLMRRGAMALAENVGRAIAIITILVAALVLFCDVGFTDFGTEHFTSTLVVMLIASYLMYFSMYDTGEATGRGCDEYKIPREAYKKLVAGIEGKHLGALRSYLTRYAEEEADFRRRTLLMQVGYTADDLDRFKAAKGKGEWTRRDKKLFRRAESVRPIPISPATLLSDGGKTQGRGIKDPEAGKLGGSLIKLLPMTLSSVFTVSVMLTAKDGLTLIGVIEGVFKLSSLLIIGLRGYLEGINYSRSRLPAWIETKSRLLRDFLQSLSDGEASASENGKEEAMIRTNA